MAIDNPFNPETLKKYTSFFLPTVKAPGFPGPKPLAASLKGYRDFLGTSDYTSRLKESEDLAKMQLGLALAQRGFAAMGAQPQRGESPIGTLGRTLAAPLAGDLSTVAGRLMQQRQAAKLAEEQEERQLKLSALQDVRASQQASYAAKVGAEKQARQFIMTAQKMDAKVSNDFTVDGERVPVIIKTDYLGNVKYYGEDGKEIKQGIGVWSEQKVFKDKVTKLSDIEALVIGNDGSKNWMPIPAQSITSFKPDGTVKNTVLESIPDGKRLLTTGEKVNARKAPKEGSKSSVYYPPKRDSIFLKPSFVDLFGLPVGATNQKATLEIFTPKPDVAEKLGRDIPEKIRVRYAGAVYNIKSHTGYNAATQTIQTTTPRGQSKSVELTGLWSLDDPKDYKPIGEPLVVSLDNREAISKIRGFSQAKAGDKVYLERNSQGDRRLRAGALMLDFNALSETQKQLFETQPLSEVEKIKAGQTPEIWTARGIMTVGTDNLELIKTIPGMARAKVGDKVNIGENQLGEFRVRFGDVPVTLSPSQSAWFQKQPLSEVEKIKAGQTLRPWTDGPPYTVGTGNLDALRKVAGLEKIGPNEKITTRVQEGDPSLGIPTVREYWYGGTKVIIPSSVLQSGALQTAPLSEVQRVKAGLVTEAPYSFVNTSESSLEIKGKPVGVGQRVNLTKTEFATLVKSRPELRTLLQEAGAIDTTAKTYTFQDSGVIDNIAYAPGDWVRLNPSQYNSLDPLTKKKMTDDSDVKKMIIKKEGFKKLWDQITSINNLKKRTPSVAEIESLITMFPAGMRSGNRYLRNEIFDMIKYGADPDVVSTPSTVKAKEKENVYTDSINNMLEAAKNRYNNFVEKGALPERLWDSLNFEDQTAFADVKKEVQLRNVQALWDKSRDRLAADKKKYKNLTPDDMEAYGAATELLILAKYLRDNKGLDDTGRFFGWFGSLRANLFADVTPITSGATQRLQSIINGMKSRYATLAGQEGEGRPSNFRVGLQQNLLPAFTNSEAINKRHLDIMIHRLETNLKSVFTPAILTTTVIPQELASMAAEAGVEGKVNPKQYRWLDPNVRARSPVTRKGVLEGILGLKKVEFEDISDLKAGRRLPQADQGTVFIKIRNNEDGTVVIKEALPNGKPNPQAPEVVISPKSFK